MKKLFLPFMILLNFSACSDFFNSDVQKKNINKNQTLADQDLQDPFDIDFQEPTVGAFSEKKMLLNLGLNVIFPLVESFHQEALILQFRIKESCSDPSLESDVKAQFSRVIEAYHKVEALPLGPLIERNSEQLDLKSQFYAWPISNFCIADRIVSQPAAGGSSQIKVPFNAKGIDVIEYLIFSDLSAVRCNLKAYPELSAWLSQTVEHRQKSRCEYASKLAVDISRLSLDLKNKWDRQKGNYSKTLVDSKKFPDIKKAINAYSDALYNFETVKDIRLGIPLGKNKKECLSADLKCPDRVEHIFSNQGLRAISARLRAFKLGFFGGLDSDSKAFGIDDYLSENGHQNLTQKMKDLILNAEISLVTIEKAGSFNTQVENLDTQACQETTLTQKANSLCGLYEDIRAINNLLKSEILIALSLAAPPIYQGDND